MGMLSGLCCEFMATGWTCKRFFLCGVCMCVRFKKKKVFKVVQFLDWKQLWFLICVLIQRRGGRWSISSNWASYLNWFGKNDGFLNWHVHWTIKTWFILNLRVCNDAVLFHLKSYLSVIMFTVIYFSHKSNSMCNGSFKSINNINMFWWIYKVSYKMLISIICKMLTNNVILFKKIANLQLTVFFQVYV